MPAPQPTPEQSRRIAKVVLSIVMAIALGGAGAGLDKLTDREEGNRLAAYQDMTGRWTICKGITHDVTPGEVRTEQQCIKDNSAEGKYWLGVAAAGFTKKQPMTLLVGFADFALNVGKGAFMHSTARRKINKGDWSGGCDELARWVYVDGRVIPWQVERRGIDRGLCRWQLDNPGQINGAHSA